MTSNIRMIIYWSFSNQAIKMTDNIRYNVKDFYFSLITIL